MFILFNRAGPRFQPPLDSRNEPAKLIGLNKQGAKDKLNIDFDERQLRRWMLAGRNSIFCASILERSSSSLMSVSRCSLLW